MDIKDNDKNNKVSIVLATYNRANMLEECIDNLLQQTYQNIEIIIVNDCSTDNTFKILEDYKNTDKISIINHEKNQGLPTALNNGFKKSSGDYLTWTSDDNLIHPKFCEKFVDTFNKNPTIDYLYCDYVVFKDKISDSKKVVKPLYTDKLDFLVNFSGASGFMWTRKVYERVGEFDVNLFGIEDWDYLLRIIFNDFKYLKINKSLYYYRKHDESLTYNLIRTPRYEELHINTCHKIVKLFPNFFSKCTYELKNKIIAGRNKIIVKYLLNYYNIVI